MILVRQGSKFPKGTEYEAFIRGRSRLRLTLAEKLKLLVPTLIKGVSFAFGYYF